MKKIILMASCCFLTLSVWAQKLVPAIATGSVLNYTATVRALGQTLPTVLTVTQLEPPMRIKWVISGLGTGTFEISAKAIQSGTKMALREPGFDDVTKLKDSETLAFLSKDTFNNLLTNKAFELNGQKFTVVADAPAYMLDGKETDSFYAEADNGKTKMWIINNPAFPLIAKIEGARQGIDLTLNSIK